MKIFLALIVLLYSCQASASLIKISFDGLVSGKDELNLFGINSNFQNIHASGEIEIYTDLAPSPEINWHENPSHFFHSATYSSVETNWISISFRINNVGLNDNLIYENKYQEAVLFDTNDPAIAENYFLNQSSEYISPDINYLAGERLFVSSFFQLRSDFEGTNMVDGIFIPTYLPKYDTATIGYTHSNWVGNGTMVGESKVSLFNFDSISNIKLINEVPEPTGISFFMFFLLTSMKLLGGRKVT